VAFTDAFGGADAEETAAVAGGGDGG